MKIQVNMGDWMLTMGMVGLYRIYQHGLAHDIIPRENKDLLRILPLGLEIDSLVFEYLAEAYFSYMLTEHSIYRREQKRLADRLKFGNRKDIFDGNLKDIKRIVNDNAKKISKYFPEEITKKLDNIQLGLKEIKELKQHEGLECSINDFLDIAKLKDVDEKLTLNFFKAVILRPFFGQPSFINVSKNSLNLAEQIQLFHKDYIKPVQLELDFPIHIERARNKNEVLDYLEKEKDFKPFLALLKKFKKLSFDEMKDVYEKQYSKCSLLPNYPAFTNYEEMIFSPLGVSTSKALNFQWGLDKEQPVPISSLAKLILFCAPAGCAIYGRWDGLGEQREYKTFAGFVQTEGEFSDMVRRNNSFKSHKDKKDPFDKILSVLIDDLKHKAGYVLEHLFFIEFFSDYESKKTLLEYYHLPGYLARYIGRYGKELEKVTPREEFVRSILLGQDPIYSVWSYMKRTIANSRYSFGGYVAVRERARIMLYKRHLGKEGAELERQDKKIWSVYISGKEVRRNFERAESKKGEDVAYTAPAGKKIAGIAYRLLNTVKTANREDFMDSLFRLHMSAGLPVSSVFLNVLHEKDLDFASVGTAFIAGLLSVDRKDDQVNKQEVK